MKERRCPAGTRKSDRKR